MIEDLKSRLFAIEAALQQLHRDSIAARQSMLAGSEEKRQARRIVDAVDVALDRLGRVED